ncbi:hypothetical protein [Thermogutta sp.]|uniref:hypothetical protein n=1 Tax=Thermogutta sp. TaxID=1962930 RepID=UPI00321FECF1
MGFRFFCPQGHILEAEVDQVGQAAACPFCGTAMLIPPPKSVRENGLGISLTPGDEQPELREPSTVAAQFDFSPPSLVDSQRLPAAKSGPSAENAAGPVEPGSDWSSVQPEATFPTSMEGGPAVSDGGPEVYHIPCPQGHVLETPREMLGTDAMCPFCQAVFHLAYEASQEYQERRRRQIELAEQRASLFWIRLAVGAAILVVGGLIAMIILAPK